MTVYTSAKNDRMGKTSGHKRVEYNWDNKSNHGRIVWTIGLVALAALAYAIYLTF